MSVSIPSTELAAALKSLSCVSPRIAHPSILACVRITTAGGYTTITATDIDQWLTFCRRGASAGAADDLIVNLSGLAEIAKAADKGGDVTIARIQGGRARVSTTVGGEPVERTIESPDVSEWPKAPAAPEAWAPVKAGVFDAIRKVFPSASRDRTRRAISGVLLEPSTVVATNSTELAIAAADTGVAEPVILPPSKLLLNGIIKGDGSIAVTKAGRVSRIHVRSGQWTLVLKAVEESFPNYRFTIPDAETLTETITFSLADMATLPEALAAFDGGGSGAVVIDATPGGVRLLSAEQGDNSIVPTRAAYEGGAGRMVAVAADKLGRMLSLGLRELRLSGKEHSTAAATSPEDPGLRFVFMPMRPRAPGMGVLKPKAQTSATTKTTHNEETTMKTENETRQAPTAAQPTQEKATQEAPKTATAPQPADNGLRMIGHPAGAAASSADPFEQLLQVAAETRASARITLDTASQLVAKIRDVQRSARIKERDIKATKELIERLKAASGF